MFIVIIILRRIMRQSEGATIRVQTSDVWKRSGKMRSWRMFFLESPEFDLNWTPLCNIETIYFSSNHDWIYITNRMNNSRWRTDSHPFENHFLLSYGITEFQFCRPWHITMSLINRSIDIHRIESLKLIYISSYCCNTRRCKLPRSASVKFLLN